MNKWKYIEIKNSGGVNWYLYATSRHICKPLNERYGRQECQSHNIYINVEEKGCKVIKLYVKRVFHE